MTGFLMAESSSGTIRANELSVYRLQKGLCGYFSANRAGEASKNSRPPG